MKFSIIKLLCLVVCSAFTFPVWGQYNWKLSKEKDGIKVYQSPVKNSSYKSIKVEATMDGTFDKLIAVLNNVSHFKDWVYNNKTAYVLKTISPSDYYYYSETFLPWPMSNRDAIEHLKIERDSLNRFLKINAVSEPALIPEKSGKVRVTSSSILWDVTMPTAKTIYINYIFQAEPGGSIPSWLVNMFADKGPYESFKKLAELLKQ